MGWGGWGHGGHNILGGRGRTLSAGGGPARGGWGWEGGGGGAHRMFQQLETAGEV